MIRYRRIFAPLILAFLSLSLGGCETPVQRQKLPELTFAHLQPFKLNVARIEVVSQYRPPLKAPNVEHLFPTPPLKAMKQWAKDRLRAVGRSGTAKLIITTASAIETALPVQTGLKATFTKQQTQRYDLTVEARLEVSSPQGHGTTTAHATRFSTVREDASINAREKIWFDLTEALVRDFDKAMEKNMRQHLRGWLR
jgi:hypothetical protein